MKKSVTKIMKATIAVAMAIGAGVGVGASGQKADPVLADTTGNYTFTYNLNTNSSGTGTTCTADSSTEFTAAKFKSSGSNTYTVNKVSYYWIHNGYSNINSVDSIANVYPGKDGTIKVGKAKGDGTLNFTVSGDSHLYINNVTITALGGDSSTKLTVAEATNDTKTWTLSTSSGTHTFTYASAVKTVSITGGKGLSNDNKPAYISQIVVNYTIASEAIPTLTSVSVDGSMTKTSYTTVESWSNAGLTATAHYSDSSSTNVTNTATWAYSPDNTPAAAVIANSNAAVAGYNLTATATSGGESGSKQTTGISVSIATVAQLTAATPASGDLVGVIARGIVSQIGEVSVEHGNITYFISDDGTTTNQYEVYRGKGVGNVDITNVNDVKVGDTVLVFGDVYTYNETKEFKQGNYILSLDRPVSEDPDITITDSSFTMFVGDDDVTLHETHENVPEGGSVKWVSATPAVATINISTGVVHAVAPGTTEITAKIVNSGDEAVASNSITVSVVRNFLADGDAFIIKATYSATDYYFTGVVDSLGTTSIDSSDAMMFTAIESATPGVFKFKNGNNYLSYSGSSNSVYTSTDGNANSVLWTAIDNGTNVVVESSNVSGRKLQFNYNGGNTRFACYTSAQTAIVLEKIVPPEVDGVTVIGDATVNANGATSVTKEYLYDVSYVDPLNLGDESVEVEISGADGASVTSGPSAGSFSVTFTANGTFVITVTSIEKPSEFDSVSVTISNLYVRSFSLYEGTNSKLVEGDYIINYGTRALKASIDNGRAENETVSVEEGTISSNVASIIWHIAKAGDYFTIFNASANKYLAATDAKNKAQLIADGTDDKAKWTVTIEDGKFEFENLARSTGTDPNNKWLRNNGANGWACYATSTGGALSLFRLSLNDYFKTFDSFATLNGTETAPGVVESVSIDFGAKVSITDWNSIAANGPITDYGVMLFRTRKALSSDTPVQDGIDGGKTPTIISKGSGTAPSDPADGFYSFSARVNLSSESNYDIVFCAAIFVEINGTKHIVKEIQYSVNTLAQYYIDHSIPTDLSDDALLSLI